MTSWSVPAEHGWQELRDALIHYQHAARLDRKRAAMGANVEKFAGMLGLNPTAYHEARAGVTNWTMRLVALSAELGRDALPDPRFLSPLLQTARDVFEGTRAGLPAPQAHTVIPWPPAPGLAAISFQTGRERRRPATSDHDRVLAISDASPMEIHIGPPEREWTEQDLRDEEEVAAAVRGPLTEFIRQARRTSPLLDPERRDEDLDLRLDIRMKRVQGDEWRVRNSELAVEMSNGYVGGSGYVHRTWPFTVFGPGWTVIDGRFVVEISELEADGDRRPVKVRALRPLDDRSGGHWLVTWPADIGWDTRGRPRLAWTENPDQDISAWTPLD